MKWLKSLLRRINFFPRVISNKEEFIRCVIITCLAQNVEEEQKEEWVRHIREDVVLACYLWNIIYLPHKRISTIIHEYLHHIIEHIRMGTNYDRWRRIHDLNDYIYILLIY